MESTVILNFYEIESQIVQCMNMNDVSDRLEYMRFQKILAHVCGESKSTLMRSYLMMILSVI